MVIIIHLMEASTVKFNATSSIQKLIENLHNQPTAVSREEVLDICEKIDQFKSLEKEEDTSSMFHSMVIELITIKPKIIDDDMLNTFSKCYSQIPNLTIVNECILTRLFSAKEDNRTSWFKYEFLLNKLLKNDIITPEALESQTLTTLKHDIDEQALNKFASCLQSVIDAHRKTSCDSYKSEQFLEILEWISWFCKGTSDEF